MSLYHLMADIGAVPSKVIPKIPANAMKEEDQSIPRICVSRSLDECLTGITVTGITFPFLLEELRTSHTKQIWDNYYEIVDGKQRMLTLLAFYENRFPYKGVFYNDLSPQDKNWFMDAPIGVAELDQKTTHAEVLEVFLALNEGGKPVAKEVLDHARELLKGETDNGKM